MLSQPSSVNDLTSYHGRRNEKWEVTPHIQCVQPERSEAAVDGNRVNRLGLFVSFWAPCWQVSHIDTDCSQVHVSWGIYRPTLGLSWTLFQSLSTLLAPRYVWTDGWTHSSLFVASLADVNSEYLSLFGDRMDVILFNFIFWKSSIAQQRKSDKKQKEISRRSWPLNI